MTPNAPKAIGPYSQAIRTGNFIFCSGQIAIDSSSGKMVKGDIVEQTTQVFKNLEVILKASGSSFEEVVKVTVYLKNMDDFAAMNEVYAAYFKEPFPARATVEVTRLPREALLEIDLIAVIKTHRRCAKHSPGVEKTYV